jgi:hypothetical protein
MVLGSTGTHEVWVKLVNPQRCNPANMFKTNYSYSQILKAGKHNITTDTLLLTFVGDLAL